MNLNLPASILFGVVALVGVSALGTCGPRRVVTPVADLERVELVRKLQGAIADAKYAQAKWESYIKSAPRDTVVKRVVRYIARHDTAWATVKDSLQVDTVEVVRWLAVSDSTLRVVRDSLHGELVQCRFDATQCADELRERPTSCHGWSAFGLGFGLGAVAGVSGCVVGD